MKKETKLLTKIGVWIVSFILASILFLNVSTLGDKQKQDISFTSSTEGVYVIENIDIDYKYDKTKYEVVPFVTEPYAVIKGDKSLINLLKWSSDKPHFYVELSGKLPGTYREQISYTGINDKLKVQFYPGSIELRLMEQQTIKLKPIIELKGVDKVDSNYIVSVPELAQEEVMIRDIQDKLNQVGQVKGEIDVSDLKETKKFNVKLTVYDRDGNVMPEINLLDKTIEVNVPVEKKVTLVKEEVIKNIVVEEPSPTTKNDVKPTPPKKEGILSFVNIPNDLNLTNGSTELKWTSNVKIDLKGFKEGKYEMTIDDNGVKKTVQFSLTSKAM